MGDPVSQAKIYEAQAADELIFVDIDASREGRTIDPGLIRRAAAEVFMPMAVGGGVRSLHDFEVLLANGADKIIIGTAAVASPKLVSQAARRFGSQAVVVAIDVRVGGDGCAHVVTAGGATSSRLDPTAWARECEQLGAGEIMVTSADRDGLREGLDLDLCSTVVGAVRIPVIVGGGCGSAADFVAGFAVCAADGVASGTYFALTDQNPMQIRAQIANAGVPIRLVT